MVNETPDPERYVDAFQQLVDEWKEWEATNKRSRSGGVVRGGFYLSQNPLAADVLRDAVKLMEAQARVNTLMLAAIDELKKR